jgi:hypothetical protein
MSTALVGDNDDSDYANNYVRLQGEVGDVLSPSFMPILGTA